MSDLANVPLAAARQAWLEDWGAGCGAVPEVRERFRAEAHDLLAVEALTEGRRLRVHALTVSGGDLRAVVEMRVPVAVRVHGAGDATSAEAMRGVGVEVRVEPTALLMLLYSGEAVRRPLPGTQFVAVARPVGLWHPNAAPRPPHVLCLGPRLPAGIRMVEVVLLAYQALAMQGLSRELDVLNPAGVLNPEAARWWQSNAARLPLTREPFLPEPVWAAGTDWSASRPVSNSETH